MGEVFDVEIYDYKFTRLIGDSYKHNFGLGLTIKSIRLALEPL